METNKTDWRLPTAEEAIYSEEITDSQELAKLGLDPKPEMEEWEKVAQEPSKQDLTKRENGVLTVRQISSAKKKKRYLERLAQTGQKTKSAAYAGWTSLATVRAIAKKDPKFAAAEQEAIEIAADALEDEVYRRAHDGVEKPIFQKGELKAVIREFSDPLAMFLLRGLRPDKWREKVRHEGDINVKVTGVAVLPSTMQNAIEWEKQAQVVHSQQKLIDITPTVVEERVVTNKVDTSPAPKQTTVERA